VRNTATDPTGNTNGERGRIAVSVSLGLYDEWLSTGRLLMLASSHTLRHLLLLCAVVLGAWTLQTSSAHASTTIGADVDLQVPLEINNISTGGGFGIRLGQELHLPLIVLNPEFAFYYASFTKDAPPKIYRGVAGGRVGFGELIRFGVLAHVGFGYVNWEPAPDDYSHTGLTYDAGIFFEVTALPLLNIGIHGAYNRMTADDDQPGTLHWLQLGAHVTLVL
jgi:hypothetical protein